jgi:hypothetical protein
MENLIRLVILFWGLFQSDPAFRQMVIQYLCLCGVVAIAYNLCVVAIWFVLESYFQKRNFEKLMKLYDEFDAIWK